MKIRLRLSPLVKHDWRSYANPRVTVDHLKQPFNGFASGERIWIQQQNKTAISHIDSLVTATGKTMGTAEQDQVRVGTAAFQRLYFGRSETRVHNDLLEGEVARCSARSRQGPSRKIGALMVDNDN